MALESEPCQGQIMSILNISCRGHQQVHYFKEQVDLVYELLVLEGHARLANLDTRSLFTSYATLV